ncbi:MAG: F0F1 ATP synthase subunit A [Bacteroidetes bacterium]|nr:F0F1 ATP synthase subunit A [Bacteroidota bacterium]
MNNTPKSSFKHILTAAFIAVLATFSVSAFAEETAEHHETKTETKFDAGKMIIEHISDAHDWHILGEGEHAVSLPLPVILYSNRGFDCFLSNKFEHGHAAYNGYKLEEQHVVAVNEAGEVDEEATASIIDISITKNVATLLFSVTCLLWIFLSVANAYKRNPNKTPSGMQSFVEPLIIFIRDEVAKPSIGKKYEKFVPYLLTVFFLILFNNLLGLIPIMPGGANLSGNIAFTMVLALITFVITTINGTKHYWHHVFAMPGVPKAVLIILTPIEILGVFLKPFVLMIRLFANMTAGHIIALSFFAMIFIFGEMSAGAGLGVSVVSVAFTVFMGLLELLVAFLQAYVFTLLSAMYFGSALEEGHH